MKKKIRYALIGLLAILPILASSPALALVNYNMSEVQSHNTSSDCWAVVSGNVYDLTPFIAAHPGGSGAIIGLCGTNATSAFNAIHGSNSAALAALASLQIGTLDDIAPSAPTNLAATAISTSQINLAWTASTDNIGVTGYNIYRDSVLIASSTVASFSNTGLSPATAYNYNIRAFDAAGNLSAQSNSASATTLSVNDTTNPSTPTNLTATAISSSQINLAWTASTDNIGVTGYNIYRFGILIASSTSTSFSNTSLTPETLYTYTIRAFDAAGNLSVQSDAASATTLAAVVDTTPPSSPINLTATATSTSQINLSWTASTDNVGVTGYNIYRGGTLIGSTASNSFQDTGLSPAPSYTYTVRAFDAAGNLSTPSNPLAVIIININNQGNNDDEDEDEDEDEHDGNNNGDDDEDGDEHEDDDRGDNNGNHFGQNRELQNNGSQFNRNRERNNDEDDD